MHNGKHVGTLGGRDDPTLLEYLHQHAFGSTPVGPLWINVGSFSRRDLAVHNGIIRGGIKGPHASQLPAEELDGEPAWSDAL